MFDFLKVSRSWDSKKQRYVYTPQFVIKSTIKDLMIRGRDFYAIYDEESGLWVEDESKAVEMIDAQVRDYATKDAGDSITDAEHGPHIKLLSDTNNRLIGQWHTFCQKDMRDTWKPLNQKLIFSNQTPTRNDFCSKKLDYPLQEEPTPYYDELFSGLYLPSEKEKMEWLIGCGIVGDGKKIQKMLVLYGEPGTGKGTAIYCYKLVLEHGAINFEAENLCGRDTFGTDFLENDGVVAFDEDGEMDMITSKATLNKIISHEQIRVNAKFKSPFFIKPNCLLVVASNKPVQMSPNSGMNRRLIDVRPLGNRIPSDRYDEIMEHLPFEKSGIAWKCIQTYKKLGKHYYDHYIAEDMLSRTSPFQNYVIENYESLKDGISLATAYDIYNQYAEACKFKNVLPRYKFRDTLKLYYDNYDMMKFSGFKKKMIGMEEPVAEEELEENDGVSSWLKLRDIPSLFDREFASCPAQYEQDDKDHPLKYKWADCKTTLADISTDKVHYVKVPEDLIVIDLDIKGDDGEKCMEKNLEAASQFPPTYAELSKSGQGIHLHYRYTGGDPTKLSRVFAPNIEVKVFSGGASLRRRLTKCNDISISTISSGLPLQKEVKVVDSAGFENETKLKATIKNTLDFKYRDKGIVSHKQSIDFIAHLLLEAYASGQTYDVRDFQNDVINFALQSHNNASYCLDRVSSMHFCSKDIEQDEVIDEAATNEEFDSRPITILDCEIYPSYRQAQAAGKDVSKISPDTPALFFIGWKLYGEGKKVNWEFNPSPQRVRALWENYGFMGYNNRNYDNHMLWMAAQGATPEELYILSGQLIDKKTSAQAKKGQAYNISRTDIYDLLSAGHKMSLKKWEIKLQKEGKLVKHIEWSQPWDMPVPVELWPKVAEYCSNDVLATEAVYNYNLHGDVLAREILATLAKPYGGTMNSTTNQLTNMIVFEGNKNPGLVYTDFSTGKSYGPNTPFKMPIIDWDDYVALGDDWTGVTPINNNHFPGYHLVRFEDGTLHNMMMGTDVGFGGYVYATPGMYGRCVTKDVASMHPHSIVALNLFGDYTQNYADLMQARIYIKHGDYEDAKKLFHGALAPYLTNEKDAKALSKALKTALNSAYGLTSASFDNAMRDSRNINNIVALRGALVMRQLQEAVQKKGFTVVHIKTDSMKIANPTDDILKFVDEFGKYYGYEYEVEHTWEKLCLVNDAVFIGRHDIDDPDYVSDPEGSEEQYPNRWEAVGTQFKVPYVFKNLFSHEEIGFHDKCMTINVNTGSLHLIFNEGTDDEVDNFIGRVGLFCPMKTHGGTLYAVRNDTRSSPSGTKDYIWAEADKVEGVCEDDINEEYFRALCDKAVSTISKFGDFNSFADVA